MAVRRAASKNRTGNLDRSVKGGAPMAHVTHFKLKAKPGERDTVIGMFDRWQNERRPKAKGYVRSILTSSLTDPDEMMAGVMFDTKANYDANSNDAAQGAWYQEL